MQYMHSWGELWSRVPLSPLRLCPHCDVVVGCVPPQDV